MAELSDLLGDVYGELAPAGPDDEPVPHEPSAAARVPAPPEWSSDAALDAAFADWTPGPPSDAPQVEREALAPAAPGPLDEDLAAALSAALADTPAPARRSRTDAAGWQSKPLVFVPDPANLSLAEPEPEPEPAASADEPAQPAGETEGTEPLAFAVPAARRWDRGDDDILPRGAGPQKRFRLR